MANKNFTQFTEEESPTTGVWLAGTNAEESEERKFRAKNLPFLQSDLVSAFALTFLSQDDPASVRDILGADIKMAVYQDVKPVSTDGGSFTADGWRTRTLNSSIDPYSIGTLQNNEVSFETGRYLLYGSAPANGSSSHKIQLYENSGNFSLAEGTSEFASQTYVNQTRSQALWCGNITGNNGIEVRHYCTVTKSNGFGGASPVSSGIFTQLLAIKF